MTPDDDRSVATTSARRPAADAPPRRGPDHPVVPAPVPARPVAAPTGPATPRRRPAVVALVAVGLVALVGAVVADVTAGREARQPVATVAPQPKSATTTLVRPPRPPSAPVALAAAAGWTGTATWALRASGTSVTVTVSRSGTSSRVDVASTSGTSTLVTTAESSVACQTAAATAAVSCLLVAGAGAPVPAAFDPGVGRLLAALPALAAAPGVDEMTWLPTSPVAEAAACVGTSGVDPAAFPAALTGTYCVTEAGLLRQASTASGLMTLTASSPDVDPAVFVPPAEPVPLG